MNAIIAHQCDRADFDEWEQVYGCIGWGDKDVAPYMRESEKFTPISNCPPINLEHRGNSGPWQTGYSWLTEIDKKSFLEGCSEIGIPAAQTSTLAQEHLVQHVSKQSLILKDRDPQRQLLIYLKTF